MKLDEALFVCLVIINTICRGEQEHDIYDQSEGLVSQKTQKFKVAVIGSGIGGASATHFLRYDF